MMIWPAVSSTACPSGPARVERAGDEGGEAAAAGGSAAGHGSSGAGRRSTAGGARRGANSITAGGAGGGAAGGATGAAANAGSGALAALDRASKKPSMLKSRCPPAPSASPSPGGALSAHPAAR
eukprot:11942042-Alexandrium_andersonii.AAC.1